ncbi:MAG: right-handed parallel beta-helix repeat-containing protein [Candidatus Thorarchaeota archaeon]
MVGFQWLPDILTSDPADGGFITMQYNQHNNVVIESEQDFIEQGFLGSGTQNDPYVLEGVNITSEFYPIRISGTTSVCIIRDSYIESNSGGIGLYNVSNIVIENSSIVGGTIGIFAENATNITISRSDFRLSENGIYAVNLRNSRIVNSSFHHNEYGIRIIVGYDIEISQCRIYVNYNTGLYLDNDTANVTVFACDIGWNGERVLHNLGLVRNAHDAGNRSLGNNSWISNRWSDYEGENSYQVDGSARSEDSFASLLVDLQAPNISGPDDLRYDEGETGNWLIWNITELYPAFYGLLVNGFQIISGEWYDDSIRFLVDGFALGSHNLTLYCIDSAGNSVSDEVWVSVMISMFGSEGTEIILYSSLVSVLAIVILLVFIKRMR